MCACIKVEEDRECGVEVEEALVVKVCGVMLTGGELTVERASLERQLSSEEGSQHGEKERMIPAACDTHPRIASQPERVPPRPCHLTYAGADRGAVVVEAVGAAITLFAMLGARPPPDLGPNPRTNQNRTFSRNERERRGSGHMAVVAEVVGVSSQCRLRGKQRLVFCHTAIHGC